MRQFLVEGMSCAACQARVEKAVSKVNGVTSCSVSLLTNSMGVEGTASDDDIIKAVVDAGYGAKVKGADKSEKKSSSPFHFVHLFVTFKKLLHLGIFRVP